MKKTVVLLMSVVVSLSLLALPVSCGTKAPAKRTIVDSIGRSVKVPSEVNRVACLVGPSYDRTFMLGEKDKIAMVGFAQSKWAELLNPELKKIPVATNAKSPNIEELLKRNIDVVFTWADPEPLQAMTNAGIPALAALTSESALTTAENFIKGFKEETNLYAKVLGKDAESRAKKYFKYLDDVVERVTSVTKKLSESEKPRVYYVRGPELLSTHGKCSNTRWYVEMAGGNLVSKGLETLIPSVSIEQVIAWDPDIILMGRLNSTEPIMKDPAWSRIKAVKNDKVYVNPNGVFYWDYSSEGPLFLMYLAKTFHPDKFKDIDMVKEVKNFYSQFYDYELTTEQANKILQYKDP
ncbi:MAG: ABC transporter substrate-binding protein [Actinomycetota bacterium]|nr:ABC transporter substrate-binding protein [Actinomycetota bacterium]